MARGGEGYFAGNGKGQCLSSYSPHLTVFRGSCPTTVGRTADKAAPTGLEYQRHPEHGQEGLSGEVLALTTGNDVPPTFPSHGINSGAHGEA